MRLPKGSAQIRRAGMDKVRGQCHCGAVVFRTTLTDGIKTARRCDCSICRMRGAVAVSAPVDGFEIIKGREFLTLYQFNTRTAEHYFCKVCGIYTHHKRRSNPSQYGVNVACLDGMSPFDFAELPVMDGQRHPDDGGGGIAGWLCWRKAP